MMIIICSLRVPPTCIGWWSFTGVFVKAILCRSPGLFSVLRLILIILFFGWSQFVLRFLTRLNPFPGLWSPLRVHQSQVASLLLTCSTTFLVFLEVLVSFFRFHWFFTRRSTGTAKSTDNSFFLFFFFFFVIITRCGFLARIWWPLCIFKPQRIVCFSFSEEDSCTI